MQNDRPVAPTLPACGLSDLGGIALWQGTKSLRDSPLSGFLLANAACDPPIMIGDEGEALT